MKILFYTPVTLLAGGGCERWHCDITASLKQQFGIKIEIVSGNLGMQRWDKKYLQQQLQGTPYQRLNFIVLFGILIPTPSVILELLDKVRKADVVHFIYGFMGQDLLIAFVKFITKKKIVVGHHAPIFHSSKIHNLYMKCVSRYMLNYFDFHQTLNSSDKEFLERQWNVNNVFFIPSGIRVEKFLKVKKAKHDGLVFISAGRYDVQKGIDLLLAAIEKFNQHHQENNAKFIFVGKGKLGTLIANYSRKNANITDLGYIEYEKMPLIYSKSDIYLLPSREEPFGLVLIEAWASGLPALATRTEGPRDMLQYNYNGWFIEKISVEEIFKSISNLYQMHLKDKNFSKRLEKNCRNTASLYDIATTAKRMRRAFFSSTTPPKLIPFVQS